MDLGRREEEDTMQSIIYSECTRSVQEGVYTGELRTGGERGDTAGKARGFLARWQEAGLGEARESCSDSTTTLARNIHVRHRVLHSRFAVLRGCLCLLTYRLAEVDTVE